MVELMFVALGVGGLAFFVLYCLVKLALRLRRRFDHR